MTSLADAAKVAHIPIRTLRDWCYKGRLTWHTQGRAIYVRQSEVDELVEMRHAATERLAKPDYCP
jgi:predicted site-specific integrase-resolvase